MLLCTKSDSIPQMEILRIAFTAEKNYKICSMAAIRAPCSVYKYLKNWKGQCMAVAHLQN